MRSSARVPSSQFVVVGGSWNRMGGFAEFIAKELGHPHVQREELSISKEGMDRFAFYKIGPVLSISVSSFFLVVLDNKPKVLFLLTFNFYI